MAEPPTKAKLIPLRRRVLYAVLACGLFFLVLESALRLTGFRHLTAGPVVQLHGVRQESMFISDGRNGWKPMPGEGVFNSAGLVGPLVPLDRTEGVLRIAAVGDSCTHWGEPPYPERLRLLLSERLHKPVEALNAGVTGYSTVQGLRRLEEDVLPYKPNVVLLYFGWNDHWQWRTRTDSEMESSQQALISRIAQWSRYARVTQATVLVWETFGPEPSASNSPVQKVFRVPLRQYRDNLRQMIAMIRKHNALPVLITAPTDLTQETSASEVGILNDLPSTGYESAWHLHLDYVNETRAVGESTNTPVVDAYARLADEPGVITDDHIHLTSKGMDRIASLIADEIQSLLGMPRQ